MLKPIQIGNHQVSTPVMLAPMVGITDYPLRKTVAFIGANYLVCEMQSSQGLLGKQQNTLKRGCPQHLLKQPKVIQLAGNDVKIMAQAAKVSVYEHGAEIIDINFGCPAKKVVSGCAGSALMRDPNLAMQIIDAVKQAVDAPITIKMRLGWDEKQKNGVDFALQAQHLGVAMVVVHGRTRMQKFTGVADWQAIAEIKSALDIPVIANGDIIDLATAQKCLKISGADGIMLGRAIYGQPWIIAKLTQALSSNNDCADYQDLSLFEKIQVMRYHFSEMVDFYGEQLGIRASRKHLLWYLRNLLKEDEWKIFRRQIASITHLQHINQQLEFLCQKVA